MMPSIFQSSSTTATRSSRRARGESESRRPHGQRTDSGGRRHTDPSAARNPGRRSPPSKPNITQDGTLHSPSSGENSPISPRSPELRAEMKSGQIFSGPGGVFQLATEPQTPAALLQYLDTEDEDAPVEPLTKAKTESHIRPLLAADPPVRPQPTTIHQYREKDVAGGQQVQQAQQTQQTQQTRQQAQQAQQAQQSQTTKKETSPPTARQRALTASRPRPQSAYYHHYLDGKKDEPEEAAISEPETPSKQAVAANRLRRQAPVPAKYAESSTDGTDSTSESDGSSDEEDEADDYQVIDTPRPASRLPSFPVPKTSVNPAVPVAAQSAQATVRQLNQPLAAPVAQPSVVAAPSAATETPAPPAKLERTPTVLQYQEVKSSASATQPEPTSQIAKPESSVADGQPAASASASASSSLSAPAPSSVSASAPAPVPASTLAPANVSAPPAVSTSVPVSASAPAAVPASASVVSSTVSSVSADTPAPAPAPTVVASVPAPPLPAAKPPQALDAFQSLEDESDQITPTQEPRRELFVAGKSVQMNPDSMPKLQHSITSQYFPSQRKPAAAQPSVREHSETGPKPAVKGTANVTSPTATTTIPVPSASQYHNAALQYLDKEDKRPAPQPIQREPSHKGARARSTSRPAIQKVSPAAYGDKAPMAQPLQLEPSNKGAKSPETARPPMPLASAAYFEKFNKVQAGPAAPPPQWREPVEPALKSPVTSTRPLAHVFPAQHYQDFTDSTIHQSRKDPHDASVRTPPVSYHPSPAPSHGRYAPPVSQSPAVPSRPPTPESGMARDDDETVTGGSPPQMSMSMPQLPPHNYHGDRFPQISRAFTPPTFPMRESDPSQVAQPMPMYPYAMQDPRAYYTQYPNMQQGNPYMIEAQYGYAPPPLPPPPPPPPPQPAQHSGFYSNSPDPYRHRHRLSVASIGADSRHTPEMLEPTPSIGQTRPATGRTSPQEEGADLLSRIQHALPDLQMLLSRCEEVTGHHKEAVKQLPAPPVVDNARQEALRQKSARIEELEKELETKSQVHATERNKMRFEIGNLSEQYHDLQDELVAIQKRRRSSDQTPAQLETFRKEVDGLRKELEASLLRQREIFEARTAADLNIASLEAQLKALNVDLDTRKLAELSLQNKYNEALTAHARERQALATQGKTEQRQLEDKKSRDIHELEAALRLRDAQSEDARKAWYKEKEDMQKAWAREKEEYHKTWLKERDELQKGWHREKEDLAKTHSRDKDDVIRVHSKDKDDLHKNHVREKDDLVRGHEDVVARLKIEAEKDARMSARKHEKAIAELERTLEVKHEEQWKDLEADNNKLRRDYKRVKRDWHLDKERGREEREKLRTAATKMQTEHSSLMKLLEAFSEPTERDKEREEKRERREKEHQWKKDDASQQG